MLQGEYHSADYLLVGDGIGFQPVGRHVVDVFDEDDVGIDLVEVFEQRAVSRRTEQQRTVFLSLIHILVGLVGLQLALRRTRTVVQGPGSVYAAENNS